MAYWHEHMLHNKGPVCVTCQTAHTDRLWYGRPTCIDCMLTLTSAGSFYALPEHKQQKVANLLETTVDLAAISYMADLFVDEAWLSAFLAMRSKLKEKHNAKPE